LFSVVDFEPKKSWVQAPKSPGFKPQKVQGLSPKQARKEEQKIKVIPDDQKSESTFSRIQSINNRNLNFPEFSA
jgi:hypothetical protein